MCLRLWRIACCARLSGSRACTSAARRPPARRRRTSRVGRCASPARRPRPRPGRWQPCSIGAGQLVRLAECSSTAAVHPACRCIVGSSMRAPARPSQAAPGFENQFAPNSTPLPNSSGTCPGPAPERFRLHALPQHAELGEASEVSIFANVLQKVGDDWSGHRVAAAGGWRASRHVEGRGLCAARPVCTEGTRAGAA